VTERGEPTPAHNIATEDGAASEREPISDEAREVMITNNLGLAHQLARRFLHRGEPLDDLVQVASVALVKSVDRFDPERGVDFAAFATRTIIGELKRHFRDKGWAVRASRRVQELYLELGHATSTLVQQLGRSPTVAELAQATGATEEAVGEHDPRYESVEERALLAPALALLPPREQSILRMRFVEGLTQSEIAASIGVSQMHVSRLLAASLEVLRRRIGQDHPG
jgi:RNA polymerase sigma-B factor